MKLRGSFIHISITALAILLFSESSKAQSLRIVYDFLKDDISYYRTSPGDKIGKEISSPIVGRNKLIQVEVVNFNKFVYAANTTFNSRMMAEQSDMSLLSIIAPLAMPAGSGSFFSALGGTVPDGISRGGLLSTKDAGDAYDELRAAFSDLEQLQNSLKNMDYVIKKLNYLRYSPYLPTDTISAMSDQLIEMIFKKPRVNPSDFTEAIVTFNERYNQSVSKVNAAAKDFQNAYRAYANDFEGQVFEGMGLDKTVSALTNAISSSSDGFDPEQITSRIDLLETIYTSIKLTNFTFNSSHAAKDDEIDLTLNFYRNPSLPDSASGPMFANLNDLSSLSLVKEKRIKIIVRGDMKMSTSVGLGFPKFANSTQFFNRDSVISAQNSSGISPNLAGYVNFYPYTGSVANLGGTFGIGVPLNDPNRTVNMFLGGAALFGTQNRVILHGGVTLGQVKKLDEGYKVGEKLLSATQEIPMRNDWEWGGFIGISFTLNKTTSTP